jgi:hypothetical protein
LRQRWLEEVRDKFSVSKKRLRPTRTIVRQVIQECANSAAGPDAVPFEAYKKGGGTVVDLFLEVAEALLDKKDEPGENFNRAFMVCVPKAPEGNLADNSPYFSPGGTRPISVVDASNRILASIFKTILEK